MSENRVSVIIPVYNVEPYLRECLESAFSQDYEDLEIVVVDDGSTDGSARILLEFENRFDNMIRRRISNQGQSVARNTGLNLATGRYVIFLDSDDRLEVNAVSRCMKAIRDHEVDVVFFQASIFCDGVDDAMVSRFSYDRPNDLCGKNLSGRDFFAQSVLCKNYTVSPCLYLFDVTKFPGIAFYPGIVHEDNLFTTRLLLAWDKTSVVSIADKLFNRRIRPESTMTQSKKDKHVQGYLVVAEELVKFPIVRYGSEVAAALNIFVQWNLMNALHTCSLVRKGNFPLLVRKRVVRVLMQLDFRFITLRSAAVCLVPELLIFRDLLRQRLRR